MRKRRAYGNTDLYASCGGLHAGAAHPQYFRHDGHRVFRHPGRRGAHGAGCGGAGGESAPRYGGHPHGGDEGHPLGARHGAASRDGAVHHGEEIRQGLYEGSAHRERPVHHHGGRAGAHSVGGRRGVPSREARAPRGRRHQHRRVHARHGDARRAGRGVRMRPRGHPRRRGCRRPHGHPLSGEAAPFPGGVRGKLFSVIRDFYGII